MTKTDTLNLIFEWNFVDSAMPPHLNVVASAVSNALLKQGIKWIEIPLVASKFRVPVEDDAELLLESYLELEALHSNGKDGTVHCVLNEGGLQFTWSRSGGACKTSVMVVPHLDGRFAQRMTMEMESECHMHAWRRIVAPLCKAGKQ